MSGIVVMLGYRGMAAAASEALRSEFGVKSRRGASATELEARLRDHRRAEGDAQSLYPVGSAMRISPFKGRVRGDGRVAFCRLCGLLLEGPGTSFCSEGCVHQHRLRTSPAYVRKTLRVRDRGVCSLCQEDSLAAYREAVGNGRRVVEGDFWQADHKVAVAEGGGLQGLRNFRTLCTKCHKGETAALMRRLPKK